MNTLLIICTLIYLIISTISDIKYKKISLINCGIFFITGVSLQLLLHTSPATLFISVLPGLFLFMLGVISPSHIGLGDGLMIAICGIYIGFTDILSMVFISCICAVIYILLSNLIKKSKHKKIPYAPFLLVSFCIVEVIGIFF